MLASGVSLFLEGRRLRSREVRNTTVVFVDVAMDKISPSSAVPGGTGNREPLRFRSTRW
jgi:hypothetical protein